jgi:hypothetical protein
MKADKAKAVKRLLQKRAKCEDGESVPRSKANGNVSSDPYRNTLRTYWYMLTQPKGKAGVRQVQRAMGFSSPNAALFHLNKLEESKLVLRNQDGEYEVLQRKHFGDMKSFVFLGCHFIPRHSIYAAVVTVVMIPCLLVLVPVGSLLIVVALLPGLLAVVLLWYETAIVWRRRPRFVSRDSC